MAKQGKEWFPPLYLYLGVVAIKMGVFGSPTTKVANFTYFIVVIEVINNVVEL